MTELKSNRIVRAFAELKQADRKALMPFITAGYPDLETTAALLKDFERRGVRICELGVPFSDPIADGPVIQASYTEALAGGISSGRIFQAVRDYRGGGGEMRLLAMVSYSIVFRHGPEVYLKEAAEAGFDGVIIPDLPLDESAEIEPLASSLGLCNVMLIAPTTPAPRREAIAAHSRGFIYFISVAGITGERDRLPEQTIAAVAELRKHTETPVCVGFGVSRREMVQAVCRVADGAIVGSAIVHRITDAKEAPRKEIVEKVGAFVGELLRPTQ